MLFVVLVGACVSSAPAPAPSPSVRPPAVASAQHVVWRFTGTLLRPSDPNVYENVLLDVAPIRGGGWIVVKDRRPRRDLPSEACFCPLVKPPDGEVMKLDASGAIVAREHASEPLGVRKVTVFDAPGVIVAEGAQTVLGGGTHGLDLATLDGLWTTNQTCVPAATTCYMYRTSAYYGPTAIEERDVRTLTVVRALPQLGMDQVAAKPLVLPQDNLAIFRSAAPGEVGYRFAPLDPTRPIVLAWLDRLRQAIDIAAVGPDRLLVTYGTYDDDIDATWTELTEISSGRVIARYSPERWAGLWGGAWGTFFGGETIGQMIDPRDGAFGPVLPAIPLFSDPARGLAVVPLGNGGAAVLTRTPGTSGERPADYAEVASARCAAIDVTRVQLAATTVGCDAVVAAAGPRRLLVSTGKSPAVSGFTVTGVWADDATRRITIRYRLDGVGSRIADTTAPAEVIELPGLSSGPWLVGLEPAPSTRPAFGSWTAFAIDLP